MDIEAVRKRLKERAKPAPEVDEEDAPAPAPESGDDLDSCFSPEQAKAIRDAISNAK